MSREKAETLVQAGSLFPLSMKRIAMLSVCLVLPLSLSSGCGRDTNGEPLVSNRLKPSQGKLEIDRPLVNADNLNIPKASEAVAPTSGPRIEELPKSGGGGFRAGGPGPGRSQVSMATSPQFSTPPADENIIGSYKTPEGTQIEVEGVCKLSESEIECWNQNGDENSELAERIRDSIEKQDAQQWSGSGIPIRYGKKNRIVVFKVTQQPGAASSLNVQWLGDQRSGGGYANIMLDSSSTHGPNEPYISYQIRSVVEESSKATTKARLTMFEKVNEAATILPKIGESVQFGGDTFTLTSISKGVPKNLAGFGMSPGEIWTVSMKASGKAKRPVMIYLMPTDKTGGQISMADRSGNPVSQQEYTKYLQARQVESMEMNRSRTKVRSASSAEPDKYVSVITSGSMVSDNVVNVFLRVNPDKVAKFTLSGGWNKSIDLTGIPLDSKK